MKPTTCYPDYGSFCTGLCDSAETLTPDCLDCQGEKKINNTWCRSCDAAGYYWLEQWFPCGTNNKQCNDE